MSKKFMPIINRYIKSWFIPDFIFVSDMLANGIWGQKYYDIFSSFGISSNATSTVVSLLELMRIFILMYQNHKNSSK